MIHGIQSSTLIEARYDDSGRQDMIKASGFTLIEVLIATMILSIAILSTLSVFSSFVSLADMSRVASIADYEAERQMETICASDYTTIKNTYTTNGSKKKTTFILQPANFDGAGVIYAEELPGAANSLMRIKVEISYRQKNRIIGEDKNLDGNLNGGEDLNANNELDSPCQIERVIVNKQG